LNLFLPLIALGWSSGHEACDLAVGGAAVGGAPSSTTTLPQQPPWIRSIVNRSTRRAIPRTVAWSRTRLGKLDIELTQPRSW